MIPLAIWANHSGMPAIAEFAPQAQQTIQQAPQEQSGQFGGRPGGVGAAEASPSPSPAGNAIPTGAVLLHCVGDPPRQIEDPQSPPCVPFWAGSNGGSTSQGITAGGDITIAFDNGGQQEDFTQLYRDLQIFFNSRFEFYGRHLHLQHVPENIDAAALQKEYDPFDSDLLSAPSVNDLARHGIMTAVSAENLYTNQQLGAGRPYLWQYHMGIDSMMRIYGSWMCGRGLRNGAAVHAGDALLQSQHRVFGLILGSISSDNVQSLEPGVLEQSFAACGGSFAKVVGPYSTAYTESQGTTNEQNTILQMRQAHVTSIVCVCDVNEQLLIDQAADNQAYHPEWLISSYGFEDAAQSVRLLPADQSSHMFGLSMEPRQTLPQDTPAVWATTAVDPGYNWWSDSADGNQARLGGTPAPGLMFMFGLPRYRTLLLMASGIQMAGPHLTPQTFDDALHRTVFPNPDTPIREGHVGFQPSAYGMTQDATEIWWDGAAQDPEGNAGAYCYVAGGARHTFDWRAGDPFFTYTSCDSGTRSAG